MKGFARLCLAVSVLMAAICSSSSASPSYTITNLGSIGGYSQAWGINDSGQVTGYTTSRAPWLDPSNQDRAFLWQNGQMQSLGTLNNSPWISSYGRAINDAGRVVGMSGTLLLAYSLRPGGTYDSFSWTSGGGMTAFGSGLASGINNLGQVVGYSGILDIDGRWRPHAFVTDGGSLVDLGALSQYESYAFGINDSGYIVGSSHAADVNVHAVSWDSNRTIHDMHPAGYIASEAHSVNASGQSVGYAIVDSTQQRDAILWTNGVPRSLGRLGLDRSTAFGINNLGQVVGTSSTPAAQYSAFLWQEGSGMLDLNTLVAPGSGWQLRCATDVNNKGQIVGYGYYGGKEVAFLLNPVPEPPSMLALGTGMLGMAGMILRRRRR